MVLLKLSINRDCNCSFTTPISAEKRRALPATRQRGAPPGSDFGDVLRESRRSAPDDRTDKLDLRRGNEAARYRQSDQGGNEPGPCLPGQLKNTFPGRCDLD